ncbi:MAG TPA: ComEC/Rec2 family competence protein [Candidatus Sulfotelmatobacter sp.]|nr:ComEC/Rec2 family competence protein [Candidatus Sulfotelmatobacter sp.]
MIAPPSSAGPAAYDFKASRQPMLWAVAAYSAGILTGTYAWRPISWWLGAAVFFTASAGFVSARRAGFAWTLAFGTFFLAGAFHIQGRAASNHLDTSILPYADRRELTITAHVTHDGRLQRDDLGRYRQTVDIETEAIQTPAGNAVPLHSRVRLSIYDRTAETTASIERSMEMLKRAAPAPLRYGERIRFVGKLRSPRNFRNPGAFDYQGYLADRGITTLGSSNLEDVEILSGFAGKRISAWRSRIHRSIIAKVHQLWPAPQAALIDAMIVGDEAFIDRDTRVDFQRSGTYHVLVVSGMNVSILAFVVFWSLRRLRVHDFAATLGTIACCAGYAFITEVGAPVWRATLMCAVYLGTRLLYRDRAMLNALGAAALALLIFDPRQLFSPSFQMTFVCVLIVAGIGIPVLQRTTQLYKLALANWDSSDFAAHLPPKVAQFRLDLQLIASRLGLLIGKRVSAHIIRGAARFLFACSELLFVSGVMQMGLALPMAYYFHRATTIGLPANLIVVPVTQLMMPAAIVALSLGYISPVLAKFPAFLTTVALSAITGTVRGLGGLRLADLRVAMPSHWLMLAALATLVFAIWSSWKRLIVTAIGLTTILLISLAIAALQPKPKIRAGILEMTSIDVGEGDSTLLITPQGRTLLVDAGGPIGPGGSQLDFGEDVVSPYLWSRGISHLDAVAISHGHSDHIGGMTAVLKNFRPRELWIGLLPPSRALESLIATAQCLGTKVVRRWEGDDFEFGGTHFSVLFPPRNWFVGDKPKNNDSMVLRVSYGQSSILLEGDAEKQVEHRVAALHHPTASLLKVGHHGSANATTPELINSAQPAFAVISVGSGNSFGLPRMETLSTLAQSRTRVYRTDLDGAVTFYLDGHGVRPAPAAPE